ncbi:MAG: outer-membrane lipoprotein carrier protein LolA [Acidobacteria bacterium]|nr:outer-membrane lipoprotein carrier protein LolA [Acidobacteriota bacterium]
MRKVLLIMVIAGLLLSTSGADRQADASTMPQLLTGILNKMEKAHQEMKSLRADLIKQNTNNQIGITDTEYGAFIYKPAVGKANGKLRIDYTKPGKDIVSLIGENLVLYQPRINQAVKTTLAKAAKGKVSGYAQLVGLDGSLKSQTSNYNIEVIKLDEQINGLSTAVLRLIPKNGNQVATIDIWVNQQNSLPIQWKIIERNGDFTVVTLNNMEVNTNIPDSAFNVNIPSGTKVLDKI